MEVRVAGADDMGHMAGLLGQFDEPEHPAGPEPVFAAELLRWWGAHQASHVPFLGVIPSGAAVGMAWLAIAARVPRPGGQGRLCGDVQSVYVVPHNRSAGIGTALIKAVVRHADALGLEHVTVHANERARSLYERAGFAASCDVLLRTRGER
ncbi:MAG: GNAT family N-acetyltransferase [Sporichthyaceae bacterium]